MPCRFCALVIVFFLFLVHDSEPRQCFLSLHFLPPPSPPPKTSCTPPVFPKLTVPPRVPRWRISSPTPPHTVLSKPPPPPAEAPTFMYQFPDARFSPSSDASSKRLSARLLPLPSQKCTHGVPINDPPPPSPMRCFRASPPLHRRRWGRTTRPSCRSRGSWWSPSVTSSTTIPRPASPRNSGGPPRARGGVVVFGAEFWFHVSASSPF